MLRIKQVRSLSQSLSRLPTLNVTTMMILAYVNGVNVSIPRGNTPNFNAS